MTNEIVINNLPMGCYVKHVRIYTDCFIQRKLLIKMVKAFPNLQSVQGLKTATSFSSTADDPIPPIKHLEHFLFWYNIYDSQWMHLLSNNQHKIKSLEFMFKNKIFVPDVNNYNNNTFATMTNAKNLYFSPVSTLKRMPAEYSFTGRHKEYRIHAAFLPKLTSLTYLHINCLGNHGDERMFESIHQSCPQLISLTLVSLYMHVSDDYDYKWANKLLVPKLSLKELSIGNLFYNSKCYDYLSFMYPHLESLTIELATESYPETIFRASRLAIYNMITQYSCLKKLKVKAVYSNFPNKLWPLTELLEWLQQHPTQLSSLDHSYNFIGDLIDFNRSLDQQQYDINTGIISPPPWNHRIFFQSHDYLKHLSYLSLGEYTYIPAPSILCYFYVVNNNNNYNNEDLSILSSSIKELKLDSIYIGNIYFWLKAFPSLESLKISGTTMATQVDDNNSYDCTNDSHNNYYLKEVYRFLKQKMKWPQSQSQQINTDPITTTSILYYKLKRVEIKNCSVNFKLHGWNGFFKRCPYLKTIIISNVNPVKIKPNGNQPLMNPPHIPVTFDLSHLSLDLLHIHHFNDQTYKVNSRVDHFIKELRIMETCLNKPSYYVGRENKYQNHPFHYEYSTTLNINCKYIENLIFDQEF
ncbi:unnamed protein product [Cunninghamella blakesleeana]